MGFEIVPEGSGSLTVLMTGPDLPPDRSRQRALLSADLLPAAAVAAL